MGGIIIDGRAALRLEGPVAGLRNALDKLAALQARIRGMEIQLVNPGAATATIVGLHFNGPLSDMEPVLKGLNEIRSHVAIDTVPLPEHPAIGTWPTPEHGSASFGWSIMARL